MPSLDEKLKESFKDDTGALTNSQEHASCIDKIIECYARGLKDPAGVITDYIGIVRADDAKARGASPDVFKDLELFLPLELTKPPKWFTEPRKFPDWDYKKYCGTRIPPADINHSAKSVMDKILSSKDIECVSTSMFIGENLPTFKKLEHDVIIEGGCPIPCPPELQDEDLYHEPKMPIIHKEDDDVCYIQPSLFGTLTRNMRTYDLNTMMDMFHGIELSQTIQSYYPIQFELSFRRVPVDADSIFGLQYDGLKRREWNWFIKDLYKLTMQFILENHSLHILDLLEPISINYHMEGYKNAAEVSNNQHEEEKRLRTKSLRSNGRI